MSTTGSRSPAQSLATGKLSLAHELTESVFDLLNEDIDAIQWLELVARYGSCEAAQCLWWPAGDTEHLQRDAFGNCTELTQTQLQQLDAIIEGKQPSRPGMVDVWLSERTGAADADWLMAGTRLIGCLDWQPARVVLILEQRRGAPQWEEFDRQHFRDALGIIRKGVRVRKRISHLENKADLAKEVFDQIPRGFVVMTPAAHILFADRIARTLIDEGAIMTTRSGQLLLRDAQQQNELDACLAEISTLPKQKLQSFMWHTQLIDAGSGEHYTGIIKCFPYKLWRTESARSDRIAVLVLHNRNMTVPLTPEKIAAIYPLTPAQARVAAALVQGQTAEEAAEALNISVNTVRSHLQAIYARLDIANKAQLLSLLTSGIAEPNFERY